MNKHEHTTQRRVLWQSVLVMLLWGSLFPAVKLGYSSFAMDTAKPANLLLFAGVRFLLCGGILTAICAVRGQSLRVEHTRDKLHLGVVTLFAVILHYALTYTGLSLTDSGKTALLKQLCAVLFICFSFVFFKEDKFSPRKLFSAALGLAGIVALNMNGFESGTPFASFGLGELTVIGASLCTVIANISSKKLTHRVPPLTIAGISQLIGGAVLVLCGLLGGGSLGTLSLRSVLIFLYILAASCISYALWYHAVSRTGLSWLFIIKFLEPVFAGIFGALVLGESILTLPYLLALALTFGAILLSGCASQKKNREKH